MNPRSASIFTETSESRRRIMRALWAAAILARADAESFRVPVPFPGTGTVEGVCGCGSSASLVLSSALGGPGGTLESPS